MLTTAILGLLNGNQILYATRMSRLVTFEDKQALLAVSSDPSSSANDSGPLDSKKSAKSTYYNNLAKDLTNSKDRVNKRFMKLHEMHACPNRETNFSEMLATVRNYESPFMDSKFNGDDSNEGLSLMHPRKSQSESDSDQNFPG